MLLRPGTLFYQADLLLGPSASVLNLNLGPDFQGALIAILPPGAFIGLGLLIALKNVLDKRLKQRAAVKLAQSAPAAVGAETAPATG